MCNVPGALCNILSELREELGLNLPPLTSRTHNDRKCIQVKFLHHMSPEMSENMSKAMANTRSTTSSTVIQLLQQQT